MDPVETVKVVSPISDENPQGFIIVNKSDLTTDHRIFSDAPDAPAPAAKRKKADA